MDNTKRIAILGKTGTGKSSLGNTVFGVKHFPTKIGPNSETRKCQAKTGYVNGKSITLIDTPGIFDTDRTEEKLKHEILSCITEFAPGPHAFLIVLKVETFTKQEQEVITKIQEYFDEELFKFATVVFTHGDQLDEGQTIEEFCRESEPLSALVEKCGGRCQVFDSRSWNEKPKHEYRSNQYQVSVLLKTIHEMIEENNGSYYTNKMLQAVEKEIQQEVESIRQSSENKSDEEIRWQAKDRVHTRLFSKLAAIATGTLLGALFGVRNHIELVIKTVGTLAAVGVGAAGGAAIAEATVVGVAVGGAALGGAAIGAAVGGAVVGGIVLTEAVMGGVKGYKAAKGARSPREAVKRVAGAFMKGATSQAEGPLFNEDVLNEQSEQNSKKRKTYK